MALGWQLHPAHTIHEYAHILMKPQKDYGKANVKVIPNSIASKKPAVNSYFPQVGLAVGPVQAPRAVSP